MSKKMKILLSLAVGIIFLIPVVSYASEWKEFIPEDFRVGNLETFVSNIIRILLILAAVVALIYLIIGGYSYITAAGNPEQAQTAKWTLFNAIVGLIIVIASYAIISFVMENIFKPPEEEKEKTSFYHYQISKPGLTKNQLVLK